MTIYRPRLTTDDILTLRHALGNAVDHKMARIARTTMPGYPDTLAKDIAIYADMYAQLSNLIGYGAAGKTTAERWTDQAIKMAGFRNATLD